MGFIDAILNLAGLLLWLNWRAIGFSRHMAPPTVSLASTLKRPESKESSRWFSLGSLLILLVVRSFFYWHMGSAVNWAPALDLAAISLPMRSDYLSRMLIYSFVSFGLTLGVFYAWLLLISVVNRKVGEGDFFHKMVRLHLGRIERLPNTVKLFLPMLTAILVWVLCRSTLVRMGLMPRPVHQGHVWQEAILIGLTSLLCWKYLIIALLVLYILSSYVYLGNHPFWNFVSETGRNLLGPVRWIPLSLGKMDFAPFIVIVLVWVIDRFGVRELTWCYQQLPLKWLPF